MLSKKDSRCHARYSVKIRKSETVDRGQTLFIHNGRHTSHGHTRYHLTAFVNPAASHSARFLPTRLKAIMVSTGITFRRNSRRSSNAR